MSDSGKWIEFLATVQLPCSRCGGLPAAGDVRATPKGAMCMRCLTAMPTGEWKDLEAQAKEWDEQ